MAHFSHIISTIDTHTAGEPARIVLSGLPPILGDTMADKKRYMKERLDCFRTMLMQEPRGHKDMFGIVLTTPTRQEANYGLLFIDSEGYIDMCGHSIMSATTALIETGMIPLIEQETNVLFDTPAGLIEARARIEGQRIIEVGVVNVPSFLYARNVTIDLPEIGNIKIDIAFGGNFFALVPANVLGVTVHPDQSRKLIELGTAVKKAVNDKIAVRHPTIEHITKVELTKIYEKHDPYLPHAKSVVIFGDGQLDRCPCGTGTSAMMAALHANGELPLETEYTNESIIGTQFKGKLLRETRLGEFVAVEPIVTGSAYITGMQQFAADPNDPFKFGFLID